MARRTAECVREAMYSENKEQNAETIKPFCFLPFCWSEGASSRRPSHSSRYQFSHYISNNAVPSGTSCRAFAFIGAAGSAPPFIAVASIELISRVIRLRPMLVIQRLTTRLDLSFVFIFKVQSDRRTRALLFFSCLLLFSFFPFIFFFWVSFFLKDSASWRKQDIVLKQ